MRGALKSQHPDRELPLICHIKSNIWNGTTAHMVR